MVNTASTDFQSLADRMNVGVDDAETSRALVVFNQKDAPLSGVAVFDVSMAWPAQLPLPPVVVTEFDGAIVASEIVDFSDGPDVKGRASHCQLTFSLRFAVSDVPAFGWKTYLAFYSSLPAPTDGLFVVETTRHDGDFPPMGTFEKA